MKNQPVSFWLGIEWMGEQLRAGVFDAQWRMKGKASRSAKTQRGPDEVVRRIARCALDAVDEADLRPEDITASALLLDGIQPGRVWGPQQVNQLADQFAPAMSGKLLTAARVPAILWAVPEYELSGTPQSLAGLFSEPKPALFGAQRGQPGQVKPLIPGASPGDNSTAATEGEDQAGPIEGLLPALLQARPDVLLLLGAGYEDAGTPASRQLLEMLSAAGLDLPVHPSHHGAQVGVWAAARLAAQTFA